MRTSAATPRSLVLVGLAAWMLVGAGSGRAHAASASSRQLAFHSGPQEPPDPTLSHPRWVERPAPRFGWPTLGKDISSQYLARRGRRKSHKGIDLRENLGQPILAAQSGRVTFAGRAKGYGKLVIIAHADGYESRYAHASRVLVRAGQTVDLGQEIALVGRSGNARGVHCHFEIRLYGRPIDPLPKLEPVADGPASQRLAALGDRSPQRPGAARSDDQFGHGLPAGVAGATAPH